MRPVQAGMTPHTALVDFGHPGLVAYHFVLADVHEPLGNAGVLKRLELRIGFVFGLAFFGVVDTHWHDIQDVVPVAFLDNLLRLLALDQLGVRAVGRLVTRGNGRQRRLTWVLKHGLTLRGRDLRPRQHRSAVRFGHSHRLYRQRDVCVLPPVAL